MVLICFTCRLDSVGSLCCSIVSAFRFIFLLFSSLVNGYRWAFRVFTESPLSSCGMSSQHIIIFCVSCMEARRTT